MRNNPSGPGSGTQILVKTRQKTELWTRFKYLTRARKDGYRVESLVVKVFFDYYSKS